LIDTHVLVWLSGAQRRRIPDAVLRRLDSEQLGLSPFVQLELAFLYEIGRIRLPAHTLIDELSTRLEMVVADVSAVAVCTAAAGLTWTRDPFDRLLAAHADVARLALVTSDETIRKNLSLAWWSE